MPAATCALCGGRSEVLETRGQGRAPWVVRRRRCVACGRAWTTDERPAAVAPGRRQARAPGRAVGPPPGLVPGDRHTLRTLRLCSGLTQAELARRAGCCEATVWALEAGRRPLLASTWRAVAAALAAAGEPSAGPKKPQEARP